METKRGDQDEGMAGDWMSAGRVRRENRVGGLESGPRSLASPSRLSWERSSGPPSDEARCPLWRFSTPALEDLLCPNASERPMAPGAVLRWARRASGMDTKRESLRLTAPRRAAERRRRRDPQLTARQRGDAPARGAPAQRRSTPLVGDLLDKHALAEGEAAAVFSCRAAAIAALPVDRLPGRLAWGCIPAARLCSGCSEWPERTWRPPRRDCKPTSMRMLQLSGACGRIGVWTDRPASSSLDTDKGANAPFREEP